MEISLEEQAAELMRNRTAIYVYPNSEYLYREGSNNYIQKLILHLGKQHEVVNGPTKIGLLDVLFKMFRCDILYFNWIEDLPNKKFGYLQIPLLLIILMLAKIRRIKVVWFIHNNVSHSKKNIIAKRFIVGLMKSQSDIILSHCSQVNTELPSTKFSYFDHPVEGYYPIEESGNYKYDILMWGSVSEYKGVAQFLEYVKTTEGLKKYNILIAGKFSSEEFYKRVLALKPENVQIINEIIPEGKLRDLFAESRLVLFTYNSVSVLSSASLCKSLAYGKRIIGPNMGSFRDLGEKGLIDTYDSFENLEIKLKSLDDRATSSDKSYLARYIDNTSWVAFGNFLTRRIGRAVEA